MSVLGTNGSTLIPWIFMDSRNNLKPQYKGPVTPSPGSPHYETPQVSTLRHRDGNGQAVRKFPKGALLLGSGILTGFPFPHLFLRAQLGSTNPQQINFTGEPLLFRRLGFSPNSFATPGRIFYAARSTPPHGEASALAVCLPTNLLAQAPKYRLET